VRHRSDHLSERAFDEIHAQLGLMLRWVVGIAPQPLVATARASVVVLVRVTYATAGHLLLRGAMDADCASVAARRAVHQGTRCS
jgi:hypothetical protein